MIQVKNLSKSFGKVAAVQDVSFEVSERDVYGFIGPNGAGKTTTMRILTTLLEPDAGTALINGYDVVHEVEKVRRAIGFMPDYYGVYDGITVYEYLDFFARVYQLDPARRGRIIDDAMSLTDLGEIKDRQVSALSKGMKQRLCLGKTLLHDPAVMILDEPAAGLDPRARIEFRMLLRELQSMNKTILISSHILTELSDICNKVAILEKGRLIASGEVSTIVEALQPHIVLEISLNSQEDEAQKVLEGLSAVSSIILEGKTLKVHYTGKEADIHLLLKELIERELPVTGVKHEKKDLEDVFMELTKGEVQ